MMIKRIHKDNQIITLTYDYQTAFFYDVVCYDLGFELKLTSFSQSIHKHFEDKLFQDYVEDPYVLSYEKDGVNVAYIEGSIQTWNQTYRIWNFLVLEPYRQHGIGKALMDESIKYAKSLSCRAIILEVQSCNINAINFYLKQGFKFIGLDTIAYSNDDIDKKEVRLEMGMTLS